MLAVFLSGSVVGAFAHRLYMVRTVSTAESSAQRRSPAEYRQRYLNEMKLRLGLDDGQTARLGEVLDHTRQRFREFNEKHRDELSGIHEEQVNEIRAMLKPDQQQRYETYLKEREQKRKQHEKVK
jgi:Spy/CpxP family protein refolding chaperone